MPVNRRFIALLRLIADFNIGYVSLIGSQECIITRALIEPSKQT